jgi:hypothetical protein
MWNITPDSLQLAKEELKGRQAALEARYAGEMKAITSELEEIETLERVAYAFAVKRLPKVEPPDEPAVELAQLEPSAEPPTEDQPAKDARRETGAALSRWRIRASDTADA